VGVAFTFHPNYQLILPTPLLSLTMPNRLTLNDEQPSSHFHEIVVLPTLAPDIACPEYLLGALDGLGSNSETAKSDGVNDEGLVDGDFDGMSTDSICLRN
jgi:hypothetical protein